MIISKLSDPGGIRTNDQQLRRLLLYPAELPGLLSGCKIRKISNTSKHLLSL